jgi:hypothetical protein
MVSVPRPLSQQQQPTQPEQRFEVCRVKPQAGREGAATERVKDRAEEKRNAPPASYKGAMIKLAFPEEFFRAPGRYLEGQRLSFE